MLKSEIFNFAAAWKVVKSRTLENGCINRLNNMDTDLQLEDCKVSDFHRAIWNAGEKVITEDAIFSG
jgi:hypothetical protein